MFLVLKLILRIKKHYLFSLNPVFAYCFPVFGKQVLQNCIFQFETVVAMMIAFNFLSQRILHPDFLEGIIYEKAKDSSKY